jgi:MFS family permease
VPSTSRQRGFAFAAYTFFVVMLGTTLPTPLYPTFQARYGFGPLLVTVIFAIYAVGVVCGLILFGNLSDHIGRKRPLLLGLALAALSALLFIVAGSLVPIYAARVVSGLSAGIFTGTATAYIVDLAPSERRPFASLVAVFVNLGGLGCGTLLSGLLAQYAGHPLRLPFIVDLVLLAAAAVALLLAPETVERQQFRLRLQRVGVPAEVTSVFWRTATASFASFAVAGVFSSVAPGFLGAELHHHSPALAGLLVFILFELSLVGQLANRRLSDKNALSSGCALLLGGCVLLAVALGFDSVAALFASASVAGLGQGMVVGAALRAITQRAPAERRGETVSSFFVVVYIGLSLPVIAAGIAIHETSIKTAGIAFSAAAALLELIVLAGQLRASE